MLFSPDDNYLFQNGTVGYSVSPSDGGYQQVTFRYTVDSTGIQTQNPLFATGGAAAAIAGNTLYTSLADTIDYPTMTVTGNFGIEGPIAVDAVNQRAFILNGGGLQESGAAPPQLIAFAVPSLEALGSQTVGITSISTLNGSEQLIRFGADGFVIPSASGLLIFHTPLAEPAPSITAGAVLNAANFQPGPIAPGEILSIFGNNLGPPTPQTAGVTGGAFPFSLSNVQVWFGRLPATMLFADQGQINVVAPFELQPGAQVNLQVWYFGIPSAQIPLAVAPAAPALFSRDGSGTGPVAAINQDGSIDTPSPAGSVVSLWGTGGGLDPDAIDGELARGADNLSAPVHVSIGGSDAQVIYAGAAPGLVYGAFQLNVQIPADVPSGQAPITVTIDGVDSPKGATLEIR
jgi:uncharacterized protein (TIGR03437 family)